MIDSRANQAAAFPRISRSSSSCLTFRRSCRSSVRSSLVSPSARNPSSWSSCSTHFRIVFAVGSNSRASSSDVRPARTQLDHLPPELRRVPYTTLPLRHAWTPPFPQFGCVHETGSTSVSRLRGDDPLARMWYRSWGQVKGDRRRSQDTRTFRCLLGYSKRRSHRWGLVTTRRCGSVWPARQTPLGKSSVCLDSVKVILVCAATGWERFGYAVYPLTSPFTRGSLSLRAASCGKWLLSRQWPLSSQLRRLLSASRSRVWVDSCAGNRNKAPLSATCRFREA